MISVYTQLYELQTNNTTNEKSLLPNKKQLILIDPLNSFFRINSTILASTIMKTHYQTANFDTFIFFV